MIIQRQLFGQIKAGLADDKIQIIVGPRYVGKHFTVNRLIDFLKHEQKIPENRIFIFNFDDILTHLEFNDDLEVFKSTIQKTLNESLEQLNQPVYFFFEQIQNQLTLFKFLEKLKQLNSKWIKLILTSSIHLEKKKTFHKTLLPFSQTYYLYPIGLSELISNNIAPSNDESVLSAIINEHFDQAYFEDIHWILEPYKESILEVIQDYLLWGGLPATFSSNDHTKKWDKTEAFIRQYFERELRIVYQIADLQKFNSIFKILASNNGKIVNLLNICDYYHLNRNTIRKYTGIMNDTLLIDYVNPYLKEKIGKPVMRTPKLYFLNTGLVNYMNGITQFSDLEKSESFSRCLESSLYLNLKNTMEISGNAYKISFLRDYQDHELDFLIVTPDKLIPVGITYNNEIRKNKIKTFRYYLRYCQQISNGVIFGKFDKVECLEMRGSRLYLLPLWMLW